MLEKNSKAERVKRLFLLFTLQRIYFTFVKIFFHFLYPSKQVDGQRQQQSVLQLKANFKVKARAKVTFIDAFAFANTFAVKVSQCSLKWRA